MDTSKIKKGLGRGLSSLIGETKTEKNTNKVLISDLIRNKYQPRKTFNPENLQELTNSIKERGILQPIIVRRSSEDQSKFEIIAGERRWLAAQKAGLHDVPVVITEADDLKSLEFAIIENVQRSELKPLEEADGYFRLVQEFDYSHEKIANLVGKSRPYISNLIRLLSLPVEVKNLIKTGDLTSGHARSLLNCDDPINLAYLVVKKGLSVRQTELLTKRKKIETVEKKPILNKKDLNTKELEDTLTAHLKFKVKILCDNKKKSGKVNILFNDNQELEKICNILKKSF